jgi:hypothetical protein
MIKINTSHAQLAPLWDYRKDEESNQHFYRI